MKRSTGRKFVLRIVTVMAAAAVLYLALPSVLRDEAVPNAKAATFVVTNTGSAGEGSLVDAMIDAHDNDGPDVITFNIPPTDPRHFYYQNDNVIGTVSQANIAATTAANDTDIPDTDPDWPHSWYSIDVLNPPDITTALTIDGFSQPGSVPNTNPTGGLNSVLRIEITSTSNECGKMFRNLTAPVVYEGLVINRCSSNSNAKLIDFEVNSDGSRAEGNYLGTDPSGTIGLGAGYGVHVTRASSVTIGGTTTAARNLISANFRGMNINNGGVSALGFSNISVIGNLIGTKRDGASALGNGFHPQLPTFPEDGIQLGVVNGFTSNNRIENNVIAFSARYGIHLGGGGVGTTNTAIDNRILGNSIHSNGNIGINLDGLDQGAFNAVTPNDPCDADVGMNGLQNYPVITSASSTGSTMNIAGNLNSTAGGTYRIEFFASPAADGTGFGEGQHYLGATTVSDSNSDCDAAFSLALLYHPSMGPFITATATDDSGNTSEFSSAFTATVDPCPTITVSLPAQSMDGAVGSPYSRTLTANGGTGPYTFALAPGYSLPAGLSLDPATGEISGTPREFIPNTLYLMEVVAADANGCTGSVIYTFTIAPFSCEPSTPATVINGDLVFSSQDVTLVNLSCVTTVGGNVSISDNTVGGDLDLGSLTSVAGGVSISDNMMGGVIDLSSLGSVGTGITIIDNTGATGIDIGGLTETGTVNISGNTEATGIDLGLLTEASGGVTITENTGAQAVNLAELGQVGGGITITDNGDCTEVQLGSLDSVSGDVAVDSCGDGTFTLGDGSPSSGVDLDLAGYDEVTGTTPGEEMEVTNATNEAVMTVRLPTGTFTQPVSFSITHLEPVALVPEVGTLPGGAEVSVDPVAAYQFNFGVPTLNQDATLTFDIVVANLDDATRQALLQAVGGGRITTLATKPDEPGIMYQTFPVCTLGAEPTAGGCVSVETLDAGGQPTTGEPAIVRYTGVTGHFSTWAVVIIQAPTAAPAEIMGRVLDMYGRGIRGAYVRAVSHTGEVKFAVTNTFGYYRISGLTAGRTYVVSITAARYAFVDRVRVVSLDATISGVDFVERRTSRAAPQMKTAGPPLIPVMPELYEIVPIAPIRIGTKTSLH